ncbi:MAG: ABC transporter substrate-binding protein [Gammaproteobacteria bacterium]|nr:ABC transporter substrate-binding protein [Gammaproteobacteria bacterium]
MPRGLLQISLLCCLLSVGAAAGQTDRLPTIVSTHLCADQLALSLAAPEQIISLSYKSQDPKRSRYAVSAQAYPANRGSSEEIIQFKPNIVLASRRWKNHPQQQQFDMLDIRVIVVPLSNSWQEVFVNTQWLADQVGRTERGHTLILEVQRRLQALRESESMLGKPEKSLLYLRPNGGSSGEGTYIDMIIEALGFRNHASTLGLKGWGQLALENIVMYPPDYFLLSGHVRDNTHGKSRLSRHPLLQELLDQHPVLILPSDTGYCADWQIIDAAEYLAEQMIVMILANGKDQ